jgi:hypothetical protein
MGLSLCRLLTVINQTSYPGDAVLFLSATFIPSPELLQLLNSILHFVASSMIATFVAAPCSSVPC